MGRKCGVEECVSDSNRPEDVGVTFHKIPLHTDIRPKWISLCRIPEDKQNLKVIYICSRHFLKADFCNFKGKKYMLRQGVLPSVFPWNRCKMERISLTSKPDGEEDTIVTGDKPMTSKEDPKTVIKQESLDSLSGKEEVLSPSQSTTIEQKTKNVDTPTGQLEFAPNTRIEALDFNQTWCPAKIVEVDYEENEVLVHFEKYSNKYDEWIGMNSNALRAFGSSPIKTSTNVFEVGERCMACWSDNRKFPAAITKVIDADSYEVQFDDGYVRILKGNKLSKLQQKCQAAPLFDPVTGTKQDRRDRKRKINIAALFGKRQRNSSQEDRGNVSDASMLSPTEDNVEITTPIWENGRPVGKNSVVETTDGPRKSVIIPDPRIPLNWTKHLLQRVSGASAGKWDSIIISPDGRKFRTRTELKAYLDDHPELNLYESMFDFSVNRRGRKRPSIPPPEPEPRPQREEVIVTPPAAESVPSLKIPVVDNGFKCPIEGCGKNFRRENLAQMHVKHYHPEYTKFLDSTPNVADLAYARTVGESLDKSPGPDKRIALSKQPIPKPFLPKPAAKPAQSHSLLGTGNESDLGLLSAKAKDSEIIKLLNSKPFDSIKKEDSSQVQALPSGLPASMYPDIKLKDLLMKSEGIPKQREENLNLGLNVNVNPRPSGIKTLLPVVRNPEVVKLEDDKVPLKRKRESSQSSADLEQQPVVKAEPNNVIIEGGEVIKIVQMKREEIINCTCGVTEEDGLMMQCELCLCWQHAYCNNIERENQVPEKYVCYICQNPVRQRSSQRYVHDQDWLKNGALPTGAFHCRDEEALGKRFERLKKSHDLSGGLLELKDFLHTLRVKIKIAEAKNHPKLYLWSKPWEKLPLPEEQEIKPEPLEYPEPKSEPGEPSMLMSLLKTGREEEKPKPKPEPEPEPAELSKLDLNTFMDSGLPMRTMPMIPQPEAAIDSADCRINLLEHIGHCQSLVEKRLSDFESQIRLLDTIGATDKNDDYPEIRQTTQMILRDLNTLKELSACPNV